MLGLSQEPSYTLGLRHFSLIGNTVQKRILITGADFENKGAEAMLRVVQRRILARLDNAVGLLMTSRSWSDDELQGLIPWWPYPRSHVKLLLSAVCGYMRMFKLPRGTWLTWPIPGLNRDRFRFSAVIDISGYAFGDPWKARERDIRQHLQWPQKLKRLTDRFPVSPRGVLHSLPAPIIYLPQAWGPFETTAARSGAERVLAHAEKVYARDRVSWDWLRHLQSYSEDKVAIGSDIAFAFDGAPALVGQALLAELGLKLRQQPLVGIVPNSRMYQQTGWGEADNPYVRILAEIAQYFTREHGCQVILMPHELIADPARRPDDRDLGEFVMQVVADRQNVFLANGMYSAEQLKSMIGAVDLLVTSRFHAAVAALSLRQPTMVVGWSHKYAELLQSVGLGEFAVSLKELSIDAIKELCERAWNSRMNSRRLLQEHVPAHERSAAVVLDDVVRFIADI